MVCLGTGAASRSFTSTAVNVVTRNERQKVRVERNPTKKGYMRLHTNLGDLNLELHCDLAPRTCENFFILSEGGYYTDTVFHRNIKNFMIQASSLLTTSALLPGLLKARPLGITGPEKHCASAGNSTISLQASKMTLVRRRVSEKLFFV